MAQHRRRTLLIAAGLAAAGPRRVRAQPAPAASTAPSPPASGPAPRPPLLERLQALGLVASPGRLPTWHPAEAGARATALRELIEEAMAYFDAELGVQAPLNLAVLSRSQWESLGLGQPYGIPGVAGQPPVIFMPATDDGLAAEDALSLKDRVAPATRQRLAAANGSYEAAARRYVDAVGLHELGHVYQRRLGIRANCLWLDELLATYFAYAFMRERRPLLAALWDDILQAYTEAVQPAHRNLADFDRLYFGVGAQNYVWYQAQFQRLVRAGFEARGLALLRDLRSAFATPVASPLAPDVILQRLEPHLPGARAWAAALQAGAR
jgi:hypothetical protein